MELITNESIKAALMAKRTKETSHATPEEYVSTGSTTFNLGCSGRTDCGFKKGHYYHLVGDSSSGKTFFAMTCLAEAAINEAFDDYDLIHIDAEHGNLFNTQTFWPVLEDRVEVIDDVDSVEAFWDFLINRLQSGRKCIVILDSEDVLPATADVKKYKKQAAARKKGNEEKGSYGTNKARENSGKFPMVMSLLKKTGSILIIISQTRDKIGQGFAAMFTGPEKTYSGGHALKFYSTLQIWLSVKQAIKKRTKVGAVAKDRKIGITTKIAIKKNRQVGGDRVMHSNFYYRTGIDDIGTCIDYLIDEGHWKGNKFKVRAPEFDFDGKKEDLALYVQENGREKKLRLLVKDVWRKIEKACTLNRKNRYEKT